jgi:hypothetical protein
MDENNRLNRELARIAYEKVRAQAALKKARDRFGGENPAPIEPPMPAIIAQFGEWAVTPFGLECLTHPYEIQWDSITDDRVGDAFWLEKLSSKAWVNLMDFAEALRHGRTIHRYLQGISDNNAVE